MTITHEKGIAHCFRCNHVEHRDGLVRAGSVMPIILEQKHETLSEYWRALWDACDPIHGAAREYLQARNCVVPPKDGHLRCHAALKHPSGHVGPAMVALITDQVTGEPLSLHRTWVKPDGRKATDPPRLLIPNHRKQGGVVRLWPNEAVTHGLGIAEGIETALSLAHAFTPVWALIDAGNLKEFGPLPGIEALTIAVDHDAAGISAAEDCALRWIEAGAETRFIMSPTTKGDINDMAVAA
ncbi:DUF7146 domain-containing protein [Solimonas soli]|uniref:DUF7146 domain-containing protein n=1 Tax=Solimonas soli TaxID=413479 RepID=UPI0004AE03E4|nr:toprim domain-containing protein [Solimonas soli]